MYSTTQGRFLSRDPLWYVDGLHEFVKANPISFLDPYGQDCCCCCVDDLTIKFEGDVEGEYSLGAYFSETTQQKPSKEYWDFFNNRRKLGWFAPTFSGGLFVGTAFQVIGKFHTIPDTNTTEGCRYSPLIRKTYVKGGLPGGLYNDAKRLGIDPNIETGMSDGFVQGSRRTLGPGVYSWVDIPGTDLSWKKNEFQLCFESSPNCSCPITKICIEFSLQIEFSDRIYVHRSPPITTKYN